MAREEEEEVTIVRDEWDRSHLGTPQIYRVPFFRPIGVTEEPLGSTVRCDQIIFAPEYDTDVHFPDYFIKVWDVPWRWYCQDCYAACGDRRDVFKTDWVRREDLGGKGSRETGGFSEATHDQQRQMNEHAKQHSIMWAWAKGLK